MFFGHLELSGCVMKGTCDWNWNLTTQSGKVDVQSVYLMKCIVFRALNLSE